MHRGSENHMEREKVIREDVGEEIVLKAVVKREEITVNSRVMIIQMLITDGFKEELAACRPV